MLARYKEGRQRRWRRQSRREDTQKEKEEEIEKEDGEEKGKETYRSPGTWFSYLSVSENCTLGPC